MTHFLRFFVPLAFADDSGAHELGPIALYGALILPEDRAFRSLDMSASLFASNLLKTPERRAQFKEFHAYDLIRGEGVFKDEDGTNKSERFETIHLLLSRVRDWGTAFVYSAVDRSAFQTRPVIGMRPLTLAFRTCLIGVDDVFREEATQAYESGAKTIPERLCVYIVDDVEDLSRKKPLQEQYRELRTQRLAEPRNNPVLTRALDGIVFADSTEMLGLQLADLCSCIMLGVLRGFPDEKKFLTEFKDIVRPAIDPKKAGVDPSLFMKHK